MKTIKIIDLLNNIANGVTYSRKARIRYFDRKNDYKDECILNEVAIGYRLYNQNIELNDEVEILDEEDEFEDIREITQECFDNWTCAKHINQLIKNQKKIIERIKNND